MHAHSDYTIKLIGTEHDRKKAAAILGELLQENFDEAGFIETGVAEIEETYEVVFFEDIVDMAEKGKVADERELLDTLAAQKQLTERANDYLMDNLDGLTPGREKLVAQKMSSFEIVEADTGKSLTDMVQEAKEAMPSQEAYITSKIAHHDMETHDAFGL